MRRQNRRRSPFIDDLYFVRTVFTQSELKSGNLDPLQLTLDSNTLDSDNVYGKLHAKFVFFDRGGFVGTTNLDYRFRLYNNEMGFFFVGDELKDDLALIFDELKDNSYLWGTPQWLEMRKALNNIDGIKGKSTKRQRKIYTDFIRPV